MVLIDTPEALAYAAGRLQAAASAGATVAVDCEGKNLSRSGQLSVLQAATRQECFVVDVLRLGRHAVGGALKELLEDAGVRKVMFDCRRDSDAIYHQLGIRLRGVCDLQLKEMMGREESPDEHARSLMFLGKNVQREPHVYQHIYQLWGLKRCLQELGVVSGEDLERKQSVAKQFRDDPDFWVRRPLPDDAVLYAEQDVIALFVVEEQLPAVSLGEWRAASEAYESIFRDMEIEGDEFVEHGFLPLHVVIGVPPNSSGALRACSGCQRRLPSSTVSHSLKRTSQGSLYCTLCYAIGVMHQNRAYAKEMERNRGAHAGRRGRPGKYQLSKSVDAGVKPCAFYGREGGCRNGSSCKFSHC